VAAAADAWLVCEKARRQSFWKQHELQPADARERRSVDTAVDASADTSADATTASKAIIEKAFIKWVFLF